MNNEQNLKMMTIQQANTVAAEMTAHIANYKTRKDIECTAFVVLKNGMPLEAVKIAIDFILEAPKYKK